MLSPTAPLCAPQHHTEAVLLAHARSFGVEVVFGQEVLRVDVGDEGAEALIRERDRSARWTPATSSVPTALAASSGRARNRNGRPGAIDT